MYLNEWDIYRALVSLGATKVVDTSFLITGGFNGFGENTLGNPRNAQKESILYNALIRFSCNGLTFPIETIEEFREGTRFLERRLNKLKPMITWPIRPRTDTTYEAYKRLNDIFEKRIEVEDVLSQNPTEKYLENNEVNSGILDAVSCISKRYVINRDYSSGYNGKTRPGRERHKVNDGRIFAKAFQAASVGPVILITRDTDFHRMHEAFYLGVDDLSSDYKFEVPEYPVILVIDFLDKGLHAIEPLEDPKKLRGKISSALEELMFCPTSEQDYSVILNP